MQHPISEESVSPQIAKVCGKNTPPKLKQMAAAGLAPLPSTDLVTALYMLSYDKDTAIADKATSSLLGLPENDLVGAIEQINNAGVLDGLTRRLHGQVSPLEKILLNRAASPETVAWMAKNIQHDPVLEIIAANEQRLLEFPYIIEALYNNKFVRMSTADRAVELAIRNNVELKGISCFEELKAALKGDPQTPKADDPRSDDETFKKSLELQIWKELDEKAIGEAYDEIDGNKPKGETAKKIETLEQSIARMSISSKIRTATLGSSSQRAILIRDSNKLVSMAVVQSPGLSEAEVVLYSKYRSLPEEAVRYMARNREWTKHYSVKLNLVRNPRCPLEISMRFLTYLRNNDVRSLEKDKNIPQAIAVAAKKLRNKRMK